MWHVHSNLFVTAQTSSAWEHLRGFTACSSRVTYCLLLLMFYSIAYLNPTPDRYIIDFWSPPRAPCVSRAPVVWFSLVMWCAVGGETGRSGEQGRRGMRPGRGGGRGGEEAVQFDEDRRVVRVTVAIFMCNEETASEEAAISKRILFIVSPPECVLHAVSRR